MQFGWLDVGEWSYLIPKAVDVRLISDFKDCFLSKSAEITEEVEYEGIGINSMKDYLLCNSLVVIILKLGYGNV